MKFFKWLFKKSQPALQRTSRLYVIRKELGEPPHEMKTIIVHNSGNASEVTFVSTSPRAAYFNQLRTP